MVFDGGGDGVVALFTKIMVLTLVKLWEFMLISPDMVPPVKANTFADNANADSAIPPSCNNVPVVSTNVVTCPATDVPIVLLTVKLLVTLPLTLAKLVILCEFIFISPDMVPPASGKYAVNALVVAKINVVGVDVVNAKLVPS